jgi:hypothetical protein
VSGNRLIQEEREILKVTERKVLRRAIFLVFLGFGILSFLRMVPLAIGFLFGGGVSLLNFRLLAMDIKRVLNLNEKKAFSFSRNRSILRYLVCAVSLSGIFIVGGKEALLGAAMGLLTVKIAIFSLYLYPLGGNRWIKS